MRKAIDRPRPIHITAAAMAAAVAALLAGCNDRPPVALSTQYDPGNAPLRQQHPALKSTGVTGPACAVQLGEIRDLRLDPQSMGAIGYRPIRSADPVSWVRSGLVSITNDRRIAFVGADPNASFEIGADLMKAYILSQATQKSANVVLRIHYSRNGATWDERIYRGVDVGANWVGGEDESQSALDRALSSALEQIRQDLLTRCAAPK
jgi:hypothetical protein